MLRKALIAALLTGGAIVAMPAAAHAQRGAQNCDQAETPARSSRRSVFGSIAGNVAGRLVGSSGAGRLASGLGVPVQSMLTDAFMGILDCSEQRKAADATNQLTERAERGARVGESVTWESETRPGVVGRSTITAIDRPPATPDGQRCMTVTDIVIIDGEETRVPKRMCRTPPSNRWARAA